MLPFLISEIKDMHLRPYNQQRAIWQGKSGPIGVRNRKFVAFCEKEREKENVLCEKEKERIAQIQKKEKKIEEKEKRS